MKMPPKPLLLVIIALILIIGNFNKKEEHQPQSPQIEQSSQSLAAAVQNRAHKIWVSGRAEVVALLPDDTQGSRHQRILIVPPGSNKTVLIAHNIDIAPRIKNIKKGDSISFAGEYIWNEKGGVLHWTHHDPQGRKKGGWLEFYGKKYQ